MLMQDIKSMNFEPLRAAYPELANMGGYAENYVYSDPESALVKLRNFAERMVDVLYTRLRLPQAPLSNFVDLLKNESFRMVADPLVQDKLHLIRRLGIRRADRLRKFQDPANCSRMDLLESCLLNVRSTLRPA